MSIQGILNQQARNYLKLTSQYINELQTKDPTDAANARGMVDIKILQTSPAVGYKTEEQLAEFDAMVLQCLYRCYCDLRYDEEIHMGFKSYKETKI